MNSWKSKDGLIRVEALPKGDPNDNDNLRRFADAVLAAEPNAIGGPVSILKSGDTIVKAFIHAGIWALLVISLLLWLALRRVTDVLMTMVPLLVAGAVTLELCVLIGLPLNFANIVALPLLLGVGVAFKIYYVTAWREGRTNLLQSSLTRAIFFSRADDRDRVRKPVAIQSSRHRQHGKTAGAVVRHHARRGAAVPAGANGQTARCRGVGRYRRYRRAGRPPASDRAQPSERRAPGSPHLWSSVPPAQGPVLRRIGAAVLGRGASRALRRALGHAVGGARGNRRPDAGPGFTAAQEAEHAALNFELVGSDRLDGRAVELSILGVVDLAFPGIDAGLLLHVDQDRHAERRPALL